MGTREFLIAAEDEDGRAPGGDGLLEQPTGTARRPSSYHRVLQGGAWVLMGRGTSIAATIVMNSLLARELSLEDFGAFFVARSLAAALCIVTMLGWNSALVRFLSESLAAGDLERARKWVSRSCLTVAVSSSVAMLALLGSPGEFLGRWLQIPNAAAVIPVLGLWMCISAWHQILAEALRGCHQQRFANFSAGEMGGPLSNAAFCLVLLSGGWGFVPTLASCMWANVVIQAALLPLPAFLLWGSLRSRGTRVAPVRPGQSPVNWLFIGSVGFPIMLMHSLAFIIGQGDLWIAASCCNAEDRAIVAAARRLTQLVTTPQAMANLAVLPSIADLYGRGRLLELQLILQRTAAFASVPALLAGVALILWPGLTIGLIFGDQYRMASTTTAILVSGQLTFALAGACGCALTMTGHHHTVLSINCLSAAILLLAGPLAARMWGAPGIASVTAVAIALQSFLSWARARRILGISTHASWGAFRSPRLIECRQEA